MNDFIWLPVYSDELRKMAQQWNQGRTEKNKSNYEIVSTPYEFGFRKSIARIWSGGCLRSIPPSAKLYILAHNEILRDSRTGEELSCFGGRRSDGKVKFYSVEKLVELIEKEGLDKNIFNISLFSCDTALGGLNSLACKFKNAMHARGYQNLIVTGYLGEVKTSYSQRYQSIINDQITAEKHKGVIMLPRGIAIPASSGKVTFF